MIIKCSWKKDIWFYSSVASVIFLTLTYTAQFLISDFYIEYINASFTKDLINILFVLGFSVTNEESYFTQVYFYYVILIINVIEKLLIKYSERKN
jgi:hypothetical protein